MDLFRSRKNNQENESQYNENYYDNYYGNEGEQEQAAKTEPEFERPQNTRRGSFSQGGGASYSMKLMKPSLYTDGPVIAEELLKGNAVIINLENASAEVASNLIFFLDGVVYAINGHLKAVSATTFMLTPQTMDITEAETGTAPETAEDSGFGYSGYGAARN
ncbi:MAG: cell division protein SepF [Clostridia bacterium]|nr:cell division protein SepF [Clostridia bacterium]MBP5174149.1 cell division protein SepF [Clostridia bacterium]